MDAVTLYPTNQNQYDKIVALAREMHMKLVNGTSGQSVVEADMPGLMTRPEMEQVSKQRMRDILTNRENTLLHDEAMKLVRDAIAGAV